MVVIHEPRVAVRAAIAHAPPLDFSVVSENLRFLLDRADTLLGHQLSSDTLELVKRAAVVVAYMGRNGYPLTVQAIRASIAPPEKKQPAPGGAPSPAIGNDTVRVPLSDAVADVVDLAIRLGWFRGDYHAPTAVSMFSTWAEAGRESHALAVQGGMVPILGIGIGSSDSFIVNAVVELVAGTHHDPEVGDSVKIAKISELWGFSSPDDMPLLHFDRAFEQLIAHEARQRRLFERAATVEELNRGCPRDIVVPRLPHGPWTKHLRTPAGEIMSNMYPEMAGAIERHGHRGVLAYSEDRIDPKQLSAEFARVSDLTDPNIREIGSDELRAFQRERFITADMLHVGHYVLTGRDRRGIERRYVARHAFDDRLTIFETIGFDDATVHEAVALAEYTTANELRSSCIDNTIRIRAKPGRLGASNPEVRAGLRRLALLASAATVAVARRAQASAA